MIILKLQEFFSSQTLFHKNKVAIKKFVNFINAIFYIDIIDQKSLNFLHKRILIEKEL